MLKVYGGYICATAHMIGIRSAPIVVQAVNEDEARGKAFRFAQERYPPDEGWCNHMADVLQVPSEWLKENDDE